MGKMYVLFWFVATVILVSKNQATALTRTSCHTKYRFVENEQTFYKVHTQQKTWQEARKACAAEGATLMYPDTHAESNLVQQLLQDVGINSSRIWVGVHDIFSEGVFVKMNGEEPCYAPWRAGEPNNVNNEDCVIAQTIDGLLIDMPCSSSFTFICKRPLDTTSTTSVCQTHDAAYVPNSDNTTCYKVHLDPKTWPQAFAMCKAEESYLTIINSKAEADFLAQLLNKVDHGQIKVPYHKGHVAIGFHDMFEEGEYLTIQDQTLQQANYSHWQGGQPDDYNGKEDCGSITKEGKLNDINCDTTMLFICERDIIIDPNVVDIFARAQIDANIY